MNCDVKGGARKHLGSVHTSVLPFDTFGITLRRLRAQVQPRHITLTAPKEQNINSPPRLLLLASDWDLSIFHQKLTGYCTTFSPDLFSLQAEEEPFRFRRHNLALSRCLLACVPLGMRRRRGRAHRTKTTSRGTDHVCESTVGKLVASEAKRQRQGTR